MEPRLTLRRDARGPALLAALALLPGAAVYLGDRGAAFEAWLPSLVHPFAFSLLAAASLPRRARWHLAACAAWCVINLLFEAGQHAAWSPLLASWLGDGLLADYFVHGTFDLADVAAIVAGSLLAAACLNVWRGQSHAS
jgi:hypothetical protein